MCKELSRPPSPQLTTPICEAKILMQVMSHRGHLRVDRLQAAHRAGQRMRVLVVMSLGVYAPWAPRIRSTNALTAQVSPTGARVPRASRGRQRRPRAVHAHAISAAAAAAARPR